MAVLFKQLSDSQLRRVLLRISDQQSLKKHYKDPQHSQQCLSKNLTGNCGEVEDVVMKKAIPALVRELKALVPVMVKNVLKELDHIPSSWRSPVHANSTASRSFQLRFVGIFPKVMFTFDNIRQDEGAPLQVVLEDDIGSRVHVGPEASVKIRIFVLDGDFKAEDMDDWTDQDFDKNIAQPRKDKGPLLRGQLEIYLSDGFASISEIAFTDNSKSMRNGNFRLGARVVKGQPPGATIRDAVSAAFKVKERRTKSYRKDRSLSLEDGVLCLKNIGRSLYERLAKRKILTVKDFLQLYNTDPNELRNILKVAENKWSELIKNAQLCSLTVEQYSYYDKASGTELVLDCVFNVIRIVFNGRICQPYKDIADCQKEQVNRIRLAAYQKRKELQKSTPCNLTSMPVAVPNVTATSMPFGNPSLDQMVDGQNVLRCTVDQTDQGTAWQNSLPDPLGDLVYELSLLESCTNSTQPVTYAAVDPMPQSNVGSYPMSQSNVGSYDLESDLIALGEFMLNDTGPVACRANMDEDTMPQSNAGSDNIGADQLKLVDSMNGARVLAQTMVPGANAIGDPMPQSDVGSKRKRGC